MSLMKPELQIVSTDVLVVGGGGAGLRAAIGASENGASVIMISKGSLGRCGASPMAGADLTCHGKGMRAAGFFGEPRDSEEKFLNDILHQGCFLNNQNLAYRYVASGPDRMKEMVEWGMKPEFTDERAVFLTGTHLVDVIVRQARKLGVKFMSDIAILELIKSDGRINGAIGLNISTGELLIFACKAIVLATGGWHKAYTPVTGSRDLTGDGIAMGYRIGAAAANMEFVTFACNVHYWPTIWRGSIFGYILGSMFGNHLENSQGEYFLGKFDPWMVAYANRTEWNKCFISFASMLEIRSGTASEHGGVYYRLGDTPFEEFSKNVNIYYPKWNFKGIDFSLMAEKLKSGEGVEVGPGAEYFEGGLLVNEQYETTIPGLYAAGECAYSLFGANRVAAATMEMLTTGAIAGHSAGDYAAREAAAEIDYPQVGELAEKINRPRVQKDGINPARVRANLQMNAQDKMSPVRNDAELRSFLVYLNDLRAELPAVAAQTDEKIYNQSWLEALELENLIQVLELSARAALERTESRGVHYREDHPYTNNEDWLKEIILENTGAGMKISHRHIDTSHTAPPRGKTPYIDMIKRMMQGHSDIGGNH